MLAAGLHTRRGDDPDLLLQVDFGPGCAGHFTGASGCQNEEPKGECAHAIGPAKACVSRRQVVNVDRTMVDNGAHFGASREYLVQMATPPGRIFASTKASNLGPIQNPLDASPKTGSCLWPCLPDRIEHARNVCCAEVGHGRRANDRRGVGVQRVVPLLTMFLTAPRRLVAVQKLLGRLVEGKPSRALKPLATPLSVTGPDGVLAGLYQRSRLREAAFRAAARLTSG